MSVSLWRWSELCNNLPCCGDCDNCSYDTEEKVDEDKD